MPCDTPEERQLVFEQLADPTVFNRRRTYPKLGNWFGSLFPKGPDVSTSGVGFTNRLYRALAVPANSKVCGIGCIT